jgi:hypothetical protein
MTATKRIPVVVMGNGTVTVAEVLAYVVVGAAAVMR